MGPLIILVIVMLVLCSCCIKILNEMQRGVVFCLGRYLKTVGPGLVLVMYPLENMVTVDLNKYIPEWQGLSPKELDERIKQKVLSGEIKK